MLRGGGDVGGHEAEVRVFKVGVLEGVEGGTNVKKRVDG